MQIAGVVIHLGAAEGPILLSLPLKANVALERALSSSLSSTDRNQGLNTGNTFVAA